MAALSGRRADGRHGGQDRAGVGLVLRRLRDPLLRHADGRAAGQPDQALPGGHGVAQVSGAREPGDPSDPRRHPGPGLGLGDRGVHAVPVSRHRRLPGVGAQGELAVVRGQSGPRPAARLDWPSWRNHAAIPAARLSLGHAAQAVRQAAPGQPQGLLDAQLEIVRQTDRRAAPRQRGDSPLCRSRAIGAVAHQPQLGRPLDRLGRDSPGHQANPGRAVLPRPWRREPVAGLRGAIGLAGSRRSSPRLVRRPERAAASRPGQRAGRLLQAGRRGPGGASRSRPNWAACRAVTRFSTTH